MGSIYNRPATIVRESVRTATQIRPARPLVSPEYVSITNLPSSQCAIPQRHLIILDLNGTLVSKTGKHGMWVRPHYTQFLNYLFSQFNVGVWSSARPHTVNNMCQLFGEFKPQLLFMWNRENFGLSTEDYHKRMPTIKDLQIVWKNLEDDPKMPTYTARNTILLDDSATKAILQPFNSIEISEFNHKDRRMKHQGDSELLNVMDYLDKVKYEDNVSHYMKHNPYTRPAPPPPPYNNENFMSTHFRFSDAKETIGDLRNIEGLVHDRWQKKHNRHDGQRLNRRPTNPKSSQRKSPYVRDS